MPARWTKSRDGKVRTTIRVDYRLSLREIAEFIGGWEADVSERDVRSAGVADLRAAVRNALMDFGNQETWDVPGYDGPKDRHYAAARRAFGDPDEER